jgi:hypothetical protein
MSYEDKLAQIRALIAQFNEAAEEGEKIDAAEFERKLRKTGAVNEETLRAATWEDFEKAGLPRIMARRVAELARVTKPGEKEFVSSKKAERMSVRELVEAYNPNETIESPVTSRLKAVSQGKRCLVLKNDGTVHVEPTVKLLGEVQQGYAERPLFYDPDDLSPLRVVRVGEKASSVVDENPVFRGEALRPDGTCQRTDLNWGEIPFETRQLVYLIALDPSSSSVATPDLAMKLYDLASETGKLQRRYKAHVAKLMDLQQLGKAPALKVNLKPETGKNNPFGGATVTRK